MQRYPETLLFFSTPSPFAFFRLSPCTPPPLRPPVGMPALPVFVCVPYHSYCKVEESLVKRMTGPVVRPDRTVAMDRSVSMSPTP